MLSKPVLLNCYYNKTTKKTFFQNLVKKLNTLHQNLYFIPPNDHRMSTAQNFLLIFCL